MPKFLSDLEVQGKISAASAEIEDLIVDSIAIGDNVIREGYSGDLAIVKGSSLDSGVFFNNGHDQLYVAGSACVYGKLFVGGDATFQGAFVFDTSPLFRDGFCMGGVSFEEHPYEEGAVKFSRIDSSYLGQVTFLTDNSALWVEGNACVQGDMLVRGQIRSDATAVFNTVDACSLIAGGLESCLSLKAIPLGVKTALGADAYGLSVSKEGGLQLWGTHFLRGSVWSNDTLKIVHNDLSLGATDKAFLGFDYANEVNFRTFPNDGTEATYCFVANQWMDDSHKYYKPAGVRLKKANQVSDISDEDLLNASEGDQRWLCYDTILSCNTVNIITQLCSLNINASYGVSFGCVPICPLWVKGDACVQGRVNLRSPLGEYPEYESVFGFGVLGDGGCALGLCTCSSFCLEVGEFSIAIGSSTNSFEIGSGGAKFSTCTTFDRDIYTKEKVYLTELPTYSGSADPENTSLVTKSYVDNRLSSVYSFKGTKAKVSDLNSITTKAKGDVYNVTEDGMNYAWDGTAWDALGGDFSRYYTKTEVDTKLGNYYTKTSADSTFAKTSGGNTFNGTQNFNDPAYFSGIVSFCTNKPLNFSNGKRSADLYVENDTDKPQLSIKSDQAETEVILDVSRSGTLALSGDVAKLKEGNTFTSHNNFTTVEGRYFCISHSNIEKLHIYCTTMDSDAYRWRNHYVEIYREPTGVSEPTLGRLAFCFFGGKYDRGVFMSPSKGGTLAVVEEVYDRATIDGVTTGANVLPKMNEVIGYLEDYEEKTGEKLPLELYEETVKAIEEWQKDPTVEKDWYRMTDSTTGESSSNCPYTDTVATSPIVDLSVKSTAANMAAYPCFNKGTNVVIFLPNATSTKVSVGSSVASFNKPFIAPNSAYWNYFAAWNPNYNMPTFMPKARDAAEAFTSTGMSAENISKTLDSLPSYTSGNRVIKFTGSPGAAELTQDSPSVAAAVAKGWTVEL